MTHVVFNNRDPILLVGDDRGGVNSLKLSPNLRKHVRLGHPNLRKPRTHGKDMPNPPALVSLISHGPPSFGACLPPHGCPFSPHPAQCVIEVSADADKKKKKAPKSDEPEVAPPTVEEMEIQKVDKLLAAADARPDHDA